MQGRTTPPYYRAEEDSDMVAQSIGVAAIAAVLAAGTTAATQAGRSAAPSKAPHVVVTPEDVQWGAGPKSLPPGAQGAVLDGDPARKGPFALRLKLPAGYRIPPHTHPRQERVTVISGRFQLGHGRTFEESKLEDLEPGSFFSLPPGMEHFARAAEDTVVQLTSEGPWEIKYVNPADDPRRAGGASP
jgi:quercetin dioxygenase-like cupin family protein